MKSSEDKVWYSAKELEGLSGVPSLATNITRKAKNENWISREAKGIKGGGFEYHISSLPKITQQQLGFKQTISKEKNNKSLNLLPLDGGFSMVASFNSVNVSAGFGSFNQGVTKPDGEEPYSCVLMAKLGVKAEHCAVFWAKGNSMEPTIHNGDQLLVDLSHKEIMGDNIYLVQNGESVWLKRIKITWNGLELISDNKEEYQPIKIDTNDAEHLQIIGRVIHVGHILI